MKRFDNEGEKKMDHVTFPNDFTLGHVRYVFAAAIEHTGQTIGGGHYIAHVQAKELLRCDDETVTKTTWGRIAATQAYMLAYVRASI